MVFVGVEPGPKPSWDSNTTRSVSAAAALTNLSNNGEYRRRRPSPLLNFSTNFDLPAPVVTTTEKKESYKEISRRLDCKCGICAFSFTFVSSFALSVCLYECASHIFLYSRQN